MPIVSVTRLHLRSVRFVPSFLMIAIRSSMQARKAAGYLGGWTANEWVLGFWTSTCWADLDAMRAFRNSEPHLTAMRKLLEWCDEASYTHWNEAQTRVIEPAEAYHRLAEAGTLSKVVHPSAGQQAGRTVGDAPPRWPGPVPPTTPPGS
jgi:hypothetical protein